MSGSPQRVLLPFSCWQICNGARVIQIFSLAFLMLATASCGGKWAPTQADRYENEVSKRQFLSNNNLVSENEFLSEEEFIERDRKNYKIKNTDPKYCLALSGGGIRAAAYSIGVLKGLQESKKLLPLDIISVVSGGSFGATWLYAQRESSRDGGLEQVLTRKSIEAVADKASSFGIRQAVNSATGLASGSNSPFLKSIGPVLSFVMGGLEWISGPVILTGQYFWAKFDFAPSEESHQTSTGIRYERILSDTFHNGSDPAKGLTIQENSEHLPYLIVNATIKKRSGDQTIENKSDNETSKKGSGNKIQDDTRLANTVFEFTRDGMGSPSVGYRQWTNLLPKDRPIVQNNLSKIVSISGAAVDPSQTFLMTVFGRDLGLGYEMLAFTPTKEQSKEFILLTDGGHSENLGVYSLIKRNCKNIVVVDAEFDGKINLWNPFVWLLPGDPLAMGDYQFEGYRLLNRGLRNEQRKLEIDPLHQASCHLEKNPSECQATKPEKVPEPRNWNCWSKDKVTSKRTLFDCSKPIYEGYVYSNCKDNVCVSDKQKDLNVTYVKLSANRALLDDTSEKRKAEALKVYGPLITKFYDDNKESDDDFPQYSTLKTRWEKDQFLAVAELGCRAVRRHYDPQFLESEEVCIGPIEKEKNADSDGKSNWCKRFYSTVTGLFTSKSK